MCKICLLEDEYHLAYQYLLQLDDCQDDVVLDLLCSYSMKDYLSLIRHITGIKLSACYESLGVYYGKKNVYVLKIILQTPHKAITAFEIQENLMKQDIRIEIKTVYSCIKQINAFFHRWLDRDLIISYHK